MSPTRIKKTYGDEFVSTSLGEIRYSYDPGVGTPMVVLSGLSDSLDAWIHTREYLTLKNPKLFIDLLGQGKSEVKNESVSLDYKNQMKVLEEVLAHFGIKKINLVGFSYGGGVALAFASENPDRIDKLLLMVPFVIRLDLSYNIQRFWHDQYNLLSMVPGPWQIGFSLMDRQYEKFIENYMNFRFSLRVPNEVERAKIIQISKGIFEFNGFEAVKKLNKKCLHLLTVERDSLVPKALYKDFWDALPEKTKCEWVKVKDGEHLLLEQAPLFVAKYIEWIFSPDHSKGLEVIRPDRHHYHPGENADSENSHSVIYSAETSAVRMEALA